MVRVIGQDTMLHISFGMAALVFNIVLYILTCALGTDQVHKNLKFRTLTVIVGVGNIISMLDNIFRHSDRFDTPAAIELLLLLMVFLFNVFLTYYMSLYMEGFFENLKYKKVITPINQAIVISSVVLTVAVYIWQIMIYKGGNITDNVPIWVRIVLGYIYELYFLFYVVILFVKYGKTLSSRAGFTSLAAFAVTIGGVLFELLNTFGVGSNILFNYFGAVIGLYIFYIGVETPDYQNLLQSITELDEARQSADEANHAKSDFLANMSHEIRTPINAVLGMNEMILREAEDDTILTYAENIENAGSTLLGLINDILDFSKIEAGKIEIIPVDYDISNVISDLVNMISTRADEKGLLLEFDFDQTMPRYLHGDEVRVKQVITNILTNAVKYTEKGNIYFCIAYERAGDDPNDVYLKVAVKDTGIGIKEEDLPKLFSEFERIEEKRNRNIEGTGLGMSITMSLLRMMGSALEVESTYGVGSTFHFKLKQEVVNWEELGDYENAINERRKDHKKYREKFIAPEARVLVVDDNRMNLMVFGSLIKQTMVQIDTAESGAAGLELTGKNKYDIIFLDHMMPEMDGIETLRRLRNQTDGPNTTTPVICLTANAISGARESYISSGFEDYLSKPIDSGELEAMLIDFLPEDKIREPLEKKTVSSDSNIVPEELMPLMGSSIDVKAGIKSSGDLEFYKTVLKVFYETIDDKARELDHFFEEKDFKNYTIRIHALKSSARIIGAMAFGEAAQELENAGRAEDWDYLSSHHPGFMGAYRGFKELLSLVFAEQKTDVGPEASDKVMAGIYDRIRSAAEAMDYGELEDIIDEMSGYTIPEGERSKWDSIMSAFDRIDYDAVLEVLDQT